ncbi:MAG TPA: ATP-binding cassette domain-containing protein [Solirubrobacteraceae bacterium]|nr:ATP-binding cassette domain-containing protein [Solirubrobacteraceae bacterium]
MLREITLGVSEGERIGVVGPNGGGKSTLLRLIASIEQPDRASHGARGGAERADGGCRLQLREARRPAVRARAARRRCRPSQRKRCAAWGPQFNRSAWPPTSRREPRSVQPVAGA